MGGPFIYKNNKAQTPSQSKILLIVFAFLATYSSCHGLNIFCLLAVSKTVNSFYQGINSLRYTTCFLKPIKQTCSDHQKY